MKTIEFNIYPKVDVLEGIKDGNYHISCDIEHYKNIANLILSEQNFETKKKLFFKQFNGAKIHEGNLTEGGFNEALDLMKKAVVGDVVAYPKYPEILNK